MKKQSLFAYILRLSVTLLIIAAMVALALAGVNAITGPVIAELNEKKTQEAVEKVLPGGGEEMTLTGDTGLVKAAYASDAGYAILVEPTGFGGTISMMVGVDKAGNVLGVSIISHAETPSLGAVAADKTSAGENFRNQFVGQSGSVTVEAISGATITSKAVAAGVDAALAFAATLG
jgi:electron transport complex protein RnfG